MYLRNRSELQFNVIQAVALAELNGLEKENAYGRKPLLKNDQGEYDPTLPDVAGPYSYWDHVDRVIDMAESFGIYIALLPTWGDKFHLMWGKGPDIFDSNNAYIYGKWLGERYKNRKNIIWVMNGDRPLTKSRHFEVIQSMAKGIREGDGNQHLMTFHPVGGQSSSYHVHEEEWLDFNMIQSGHGNRILKNYELVKKDYDHPLVKPTFDAEPCYEDHPISFNPENGYFDEADVRQAAYYGVFSGGFGHTYGHHSIWSMSSGQYRSVEFSEPGAYFIMSWKDALNRPGAAQMQYLRRLIESAGDFEARIPDQGMLVKNETGSNYAVATRGADYALIYTPNGLRLDVVMGRINGSRVKASWYNPRNGTESDMGEFPNSGEQLFIPPSSGRGQDWVLVLKSKMELLPKSLRGRDIHHKVIPTVYNLKNLLHKLVEVNGDFSKLKQWEKRSYQSYRLDHTIHLLPLEEQKEIIRRNILTEDAKKLGAHCIDIYLVAYVAEHVGVGRDIFFNYIFKNGITDKSNSAQAIWQVGKGDGVFLDLLNEDGTIRDRAFFEQWVKGCNI